MFFLSLKTVTLTMQVFDNCVSDHYKNCSFLSAILIYSFSKNTNKMQNFAYSFFKEIRRFLFIISLLRFQSIYIITTTTKKKTQIPVLLITYKFHDFLKFYNV